MSQIDFFVYREHLLQAYLKSSIISDLGILVEKNQASPSEHRVERAALVNWLTGSGLFGRPPHGLPGKRSASERQDYPEGSVGPSFSRQFVADVRSGSKPEEGPLESLVCSSPDSIVRPPRHVRKVPISEVGTTIRSSRRQAQASLGKSQYPVPWRSSD